MNKREGSDRAKNNVRILPRPESIADVRSFLIANVCHIDVDSVRSNTRAAKKMRGVAWAISQLIPRMNGQSGFDLETPQALVWHEDLTRFSGAALTAEAKDDSVMLRSQTISKGVRATTRSVAIPSDAEIQQFLDSHMWPEGAKEHCLAYDYRAGLRREYDLPNSPHGYFLQAHDLVQVLVDVTGPVGA